MFTYSEDSNRLSRTNIVCDVGVSAAQVLLNAAAARIDIAARENLTTVTGGTILRALN